MLHISKKLLTKLPDEPGYKRIAELNKQLQGLIYTLEGNIQENVVRDVKEFFLGCEKHVADLRAELNEYKEKAMNKAFQLQKDEAIASLREELRLSCEEAASLTKTILEQKEYISKLRLEIDSFNKEKVFLETQLKKSEKNRKALNLALIKAQEFICSVPKNDPKEYSNKEVQVDSFACATQKLQQKLLIEHKVNNKLKALMAKSVAERTDLEELFYNSVKNVRKTINRHRLDPTSIPTSSEAWKIMEDYLANDEVVSKLFKVVFGTTKKLNETPLPAVTPLITHKRRSIAVVSITESPVRNTHRRVKGSSLKVKGSPMFHNKRLLLDSTTIH